MSPHPSPLLTIHYLLSMTVTIQSDLLELVQILGSGSGQSQREQSPPYRGGQSKDVISAQKTGAGVTVR